ncbi:MAG: cytochrome c oxidase subunit 3 family protein [Planctomycetota bacterium]|nr:cytochrome c oxidase subunit 3 family protein [Planctomycetota bacterium]
MSATATNTHDEHHDHPEWLAHHFDTPEQQFEAGKFGIWLFLVTEVLFFSGLFCAYIYFRSHHPEMFKNASFLLDTNMGAINTAVLLLSSFTMATAVRMAQTENQKGLILNLWITLACAFGFLVIKFFEYSHKLHVGLKWGDAWSPTPQALSEFNEKLAAAGQPTVEVMPDLHNFFSVYYCMTGLHGIHVVLGIVAIGWVLARAYRGHFNRYYFTAVDATGLYWHLVDLIWIFLFPLMYLIR